MKLASFYFNANQKEYIALLDDEDKNVSYLTFDNDGEKVTCCNRKSVSNGDIEDALTLLLDVRSSRDYQDFADVINNGTRSQCYINDVKEVFGWDDIEEFGRKYFTDIMKELSQEDYSKLKRKQDEEMKNHRANFTKWH